ncbi:MAG: hypothetical protein F6K32_11355 [Desertifilum sp. SIO1I2]|nr:hypothetical protein [Desertifilum sp. SIO1I2]
MQSSTQTPSSDASPKSRTAAKLSIALLVGVGFSLSVYTLQLQHSCPPLLKWPTALAKCPDSAVQVAIRQPAPNSVSPSKPLPTSHKPADSGQKTAIKTSSPQNPSSVNGKEAAAIAVGSAVLVGLTLMGSPVAIALGAGAMVWYAAKALM